MGEAALREAIVDRRLRPAHAAHRPPDHRARGRDPGGARPDVPYVSGPVGVCWWRARWPRRWWSGCCGDRAIPGPRLARRTTASTARSSRRRSRRCGSWRADQRRRTDFEGDDWGPGRGATAAAGPVVAYSFTVSVNRTVPMSPIAPAMMNGSVGELFQSNPPSVAAGAMATLRMR